MYICKMDPFTACATRGYYMMRARDSGPLHLLNFPFPNTTSFHLHSITFCLLWLSDPCKISNSTVGPRGQGGQAFTMYGLETATTSIIASLRLKKILFPKISRTRPRTLPELILSSTRSLYISDASLTTYRVRSLDIPRVIPVVPLRIQILLDVLFAAACASITLCIWVSFSRSGVTPVTTTDSGHTVNVYINVFDNDNSIILMVLVFSLNFTINITRTIIHLNSIFGHGNIVWQSS